MNAAYYAQRASAGLIIAEATDISPDAKGYSLTPGVYSPEQIAGWRQVTDAVHQAGGRIFLQIWHCGRMSHPDLRGGAQTVAPSAIAFRGRSGSRGRTAGADGGLPHAPCAGNGGNRPHRGKFWRAALNAIDAGFDGVEIHAANSYLIDQFLRTTSNQRTDQYGGSRENRLRFLLEVTDAVSEAIGPARTGVRLSPRNQARGMDCPDSIPTALEAAALLHRRAWPTCISTNPKRTRPAWPPGSSAGSSGPSFRGR
jgi:N-ethylmaleimide reductase